MRELVEPEKARVRVWIVAHYRTPLLVRLADRAWRAKERAAHTKPVSTKVAFYSPRVDTVAAVKPRGRGK